MRAIGLRYNLPSRIWARASRTGAGAPASRSEIRISNRPPCKRMKLSALAKRQNSTRISGAGVQCVAGNIAAARTWRCYVFVQLADENVMAAGPGVACRQHHISGELMLNIEVELLDRTLFEIKVLGLDGPAVSGGVHGRVVDGTARDVNGRRRAGREQEAAGQGAGSAKGIHFRIVRRVLP